MLYEAVAHESRSDAISRAVNSTKVIYTSRWAAVVAAVCSWRRLEGICRGGSANRHMYLLFTPRAIRAGSDSEAFASVFGVLHRAPVDALAPPDSSRATR